jgi:hypothetical protein
MTSKAKTIAIDAALSNRKLLGGPLGDVATWRAWVVILRAAFGMALGDDELATFAAVAGARAPPTRRVRELWAIAGRRSGKSRMAAAIATYLACFGQHRLAAGERGVVLVIAGSIDQARNVFGYVRGFLEESPVLRDEVTSITRNEITLKSGIVIAVHTNSFRTVRGRTLCGCVFDEVAYWRDDTSATPDTEVYRAVLPALATTNGMLVSISTPYRKLGLLHQKHHDHHGVDGDDVLVVQAPTAVLNPTIDAGVIASQRSADPESASSEWDAEFRADIASFLDDEMIERATDPARPLELPPRSGVRYVMFVDSAGGSAAGDSYTAAIAHREGELMILDLVRGKGGKFDPVKVTEAYAELAKAYGVDVVRGDAYSAEWVSSAWREAGVGYERVEPTKSAVYLEALPLFASGKVLVPSHQVLLRELRLLERRVGRGGRDVIDHPKGATDDFALACCGALWLAQSAAPALWRREDLPIVPGLLSCETVFAVIVAGEREIGVGFFAKDRDKTLHVVSAESIPMTAALLDDVPARLLGLAKSLRATLGCCLFTPAALAGEFGRRGHVSHGIDAILAEGLPALALAAAAHICQGHVKINDQRHAAVLAGWGDDPLRAAMLVGVVVALDEGRRLAA